MLSQHPTVHLWFVQLGVFFSPTEVFNGIPPPKKKPYGTIRPFRCWMRPWRRRPSGKPETWWWFVLMSVLESVGFADFFILEFWKSQSGCFEVWSFFMKVSRASWATEEMRWRFRREIASYCRSQDNSVCWANHVDIKFSQKTSSQKSTAK